MSVKSPIRRPRKCQSGPRAGNSVGHAPEPGGSRIEFDDHGAPAMQGLLLAGFDHTRQQQVFTRRYEQNGPILRGQERFTFRQESG